MLEPLLLEGNGRIQTDWRQRRREANETRNAGRRGVHNGGGKAGLKKQSLNKQEKFVKETVCH